MASDVPPQLSNVGIANSISSKSLVPPLASPRSSPAANSPSSTPSHNADASSPTPDASNHSRPRDLSVDRPPIRSTSPIGKIAQQMPLPASPSDPRPSRGLPSSSGSPQGRRPMPTPSVTESPSETAHTSFGSSPSRNANAGLGVGPTGTLGGLGVPLSKAEKRRSINPAMTFNMDAQNSTFTATDARTSPVPPSPLRSSFKNGAESSREASRSPSSPSPAGGMTDIFATKQQEHMDQGSRSLVQPLVVPLKAESQPSRQSSNSESTSTRPMSFSLSDPDFARILNHIDHPRSFDSTTTIHPRGAGSAPTSPVTLTGPTAHSSPVQSLGSVLGSNGTREPVPDTFSPVSDRLDAGPPLLRTRQLSGESVTSQMSRLGPNSSFQGIVEQVAAAKHAGKDQVQVDLSLLSGVIAEIEGFSEAMSSLKNKYTATKVRLKCLVQITSNVSGPASSTVKALRSLVKSTTRKWQGEKS